MDLMDIATELFLSKIGQSGSPAPSSDGGGLSSTLVKSALQWLLGGDDGKFDLGDLVSKFQTGDLISVATSWLGDGDNSSISPGQIIDILGGDNIAEFASKIGIGKETASAGLAETIPELIDKSSEGGSILDSLGGAEGLAGLASKFF